MVYGIRAELVDGSTGKSGTGIVERAIGSATRRREAPPALADKQKVDIGGFDSDPRGRSKREVARGGFDDHVERVIGKQDESGNRAMPREPTLVPIAKVDARENENGIRIRAEIDVAAVWADIQRYNGF